jgi:diketogulonate reductase-like aldo/keto reductase
LQDDCGKRFLFSQSGILPSRKSGEPMSKTVPETPRVKAGGTTIPAIGLGTWDLRGDVCTRVVTEALKIGYRHIDTAQGYANESQVGEGLRASGVPREDVFITTKIRPQLISDGELQRSMEESLKRLEVDQVDLALIHWPNPAIPLAETMRALGEVKRRGLARNIGVSNFTIKMLDEAIRLSSEPLAATQFEYHPYLDQRALLAAVRRHGLAITAYCPIALGKVVGDPKIEAIAKRHGRSAAQVTLRWLVQQGDVIAIPRTSKVARLRENFSVFDFELSADEMQAMSQMTKPKARLINEPAWVPVWD